MINWPPSGIAATKALTENNLTLFTGKYSKQLCEQFGLSYGFVYLP